MMAAFPERAALLSRGMVVQELVEALGEAKAKHFEVHIEPHPLGMAVSVQGIDEVSNFIVDGTSPHSISVGNGTSMPIGHGMFATSVSHPGTEGHVEAIHSAILTGVAKGFIAAVAYG